MHPDKAPRLNGINLASFFQNLWSVVSDTVVHNYMEWLNIGSFSAGLDDMVVVLIPKVDSLDSLKDLRPISLCNVLYKIIAKALVSKLKSVLLELIAPTASVFMR